VQKVKDVIQELLLPKFKNIPNRPAKENSLKNYIKAQLPTLRADEAGAQKVFDRLLKNKLIKLEGKKVIYCF